MCGVSRSRKSLAAMAESSRVANEYIKHSCGKAVNPRTELMAVQVSLPIFISLLTLFSLSSSPYGMLIMYAEDKNVTLSSIAKAKVDEGLRNLIDRIKPDVNYDAELGVAFGDILISPDNATIFLNLYFYSAYLCGLFFSETVTNATGQTLQEGFRSVMPQVRDLMNQTYGAGYAVLGQFHAGYYVQGTNVRGADGCTGLTMDTRKNSSTGYCYGNLLFSHSAFNTLYPSCQIRSLEKEFILQLGKDCSIALVDTTMNDSKIWSQPNANGVLSPSNPNCYLRLGTDGNLVLYSGTERQWDSGSLSGGGTSAANWLIMQANRNIGVFVLGDDQKAQPIWLSNTMRSITPPPSISPYVKKTGRTPVIILSTCLGFSLCLLVIALWRNKRLASKDDDEVANIAIEGKPVRYTFKELQAATGGFDKKKKLGQGAFGAVHQGILESSGTVVAIKQLDRSGVSQQGQREFINEVWTISMLQHKNLVKLLGFCSEGERRLLVYEYMENNSLSQTLLGNKQHISWSVRYEICLGVARGLAYLHEESRTRIVHRDIKASNILLDRDLRPKIADFGLARFLQDDHSHLSTQVAGTFGYLAPEYALNGQLTEKADVYSFGILALEIVSGRRNMDLTLPDEESFLLEWTWQLYQEGRLLQLLDKNLLLVEEETYSENEVYKLLMVALLCTQAVPQTRPSMSRVVGMLMGDVEIKVDISKPGFIADLKQAAMSKVNSGSIGLN